MSNCTGYRLVISNYGQGKIFQTGLEKWDYGLNTEILRVMPAKFKQPTRHEGDCEKGQTMSGFLPQVKV